MKNFKSLFSAVAVAATLIGCSSLEVEDDASVVENFPEDFSKAEYMELHPILRYFQIKEYIKGDQAYGIDGYNTKLKQKYTAESESAYARRKAELQAAAVSNPGITAAEIDAGAAAARDSVMNYYNNTVVAADEADFAANEATIHWLYVNPYIGGAWGFSEANWKKVIADTTAVTIYKVNKVVDAEDSTKFERVPDTENPLVMTLCKPKTGSKITRSTKQGATYGKIISLNGVIGGTCDGTESAIAISDSTYVVAEGETAFTIENKEVSAVEDAAAMKILKNINLHGTADDTTAISNIPVDYFSIGYHFVLFGKHHGWAYRKCKDSERSNPRQCSSDASVKETLEGCALLADDAAQQECVNSAYAMGCEIYPADRMYCDDNGIAREIK